MRSSQLLGLIFGLSSVSNALSRYSKPRGSSSHKAIKLVSKSSSLSDFLISNISAQTTAENASVSFLFTDPNSNTSTTCTQSWSESSSTNATSTAPFSYVACDLTNSTDEIFAWHFTNYTEFDNFVLQFSHEFSDPTHYSPPYDAIEYFATASVNLTCVQNSTVESRCTLPAVQSPLHAAINGMSD